MKPISKYSNVGDSLSAIHFNFACLDIRTCNVQNDFITKFSKISLGNWGESFSEALAMSSNWESLKEQVHNASSFWSDQVMTVIYGNIFPEGTVNHNSVSSWLTTNFPPENYKGVKTDVVFYEWHKNPALHNPPSNSERRFGKLSRGNSVYIKRVHKISFKESGNKWNRIETDSVFQQKPNLTELDCGGCWGKAYYPEYPTCKSLPTYYVLECEGEIEPPPPASPCDLLDGVSINWVFPDDEDALYESRVFQLLSGTSLVPYVIGKKSSSNPDTEEISENVYKKYINNSSIPNLPDTFNVSRNFAYNIEYTYDYDSITNTFSNSSTLSSTTLTFSPSDTISFPIKIDTLDIIRFIQAYGLGKIINQADPECSFKFRVTTKWYRWVTDNYSLSGTPYWHIGIENGDSLGFEHNPIPGVPDLSSNWETAEAALGEDGLSAFFGTQYDMMGEVLDIEII